MSRRYEGPDLTKLRDSSGDSPRTTSLGTLFLAAAHKHLRKGLQGERHTCRRQHILHADLPGSRKPGPRSQ